MTEIKTARIFESTGGYYVCNEELDYLDARGPGYPTKAQAMRAAYESGYTHCTGSGSYKPMIVARIASMINTRGLIQYEHDELDSWQY